MTIATYHTHTRWSDGQADVRDMVAAARDRGFDEIGISDHLVVPPHGHQRVTWAMQTERLQEYVDDVRAVGEDADGIRVRLGVEVDFFPETLAPTMDLIAPCGFDYVIGSVHFVDRFPVDDSLNDWAALDQEQTDRMQADYWRRLTELAASAAGIAFLGHLDLPKKFGVYPAADLHAQIDAALDAVAAAGTAIELNTAGWNKPCAECYPSRAILQRALARAIPVVISDDAHAPEHLGRGFGRARTLLREVGYSTHLCLSDDRPVAVSLDDASRG